MATNILIPDGAWDTHIHVFDREKFPYATPRLFTPPTARISDYPSNITKCKNIVIVHAADVQGTSPAVLLDAMSQQQRLGWTLRAVAILDMDNVSDAELDQLHAAGVRGIRVHEMSWGQRTQDGAGDIGRKISALASRLARLEWAICIFCPLAAWPDLVPMVRSVDPRIKLVVDHRGGAYPGDETTPGFAAFLELIREKRLFVKISGFDRFSYQRPEGIDCLAPTTKAIIEAGPDMILFGSDWPHTGLGILRVGKSEQEKIDEVEPYRPVDDAAYIRKIREWIPDDETWVKFWVTNPRRLWL